MPVKGIVPQLLTIGRIKIGIKGEEVLSKSGAKFRRPEKIDHFLITTNEKFDDDFIVDLPLMENLSKDKSLTNSDGKLVSIPIRLLYNDIDLNFKTRYARYVGSTCKCTGDGEKAFSNTLQKEISCPCECLDPSYDGKDKCKVNGILTCMIDKTDIFGGCHQFRTTSRNTVNSIIGSLETIKTATGGLLSFIPLNLIIQPKTTMIPNTGQTTTVYVVSVVFIGGIDKLQKAAQSMMEKQAKHILSMREIEENARRQIDFEQSDDKEIAEEFYPETIIDNLDSENDDSKQENSTKQDEDSESLSNPSAEDAYTESYQNDNEGDSFDEEAESNADAKDNSVKMITETQKIEIVKIFKNLIEEGVISGGTADECKRIWREKHLSPFGVSSIHEMTADVASDFIYKYNDIPF